MINSKLNISDDKYIPIKFSYLNHTNQEENIHCQGLPKRKYSRKDYKGEDRYIWVLKI